MKLRALEIHSACCLLMLAALWPARAGHAEDWPHWRGPQQNGTSSERNLPLRWSPAEGIAWRADLPGSGSSSPVVVGDRIFVTSSDGDKLGMIALSTDGTTLWNRSVVDEGGREEIRQSEGSFATSSPGTDAESAWAFFGNGWMACWSVDGELRWKFNVNDRYEKIDMPFAMASSPVDYGPAIYLQLFHLGGSRVVAIDKLTGREIWSLIRPTDARGKCLRSYASPVIYRGGAKPCLLTHGQDYVAAHDLATGAEIWRCGGFHPASGYDDQMRTIASPVCDGRQIVAPSVHSGNVLGLLGGGAGDISGDKQFLRWTFDRTPQIPSPLLVDGRVYLQVRGGALACLDAATGEVKYLERALSGKEAPSPVYGDGKIY
ncbi:MAG: PQQ-binding-like beta-propeller repeat protein, partial [Planctomycetales bacterium]|nr:PQQ-binding-like beta-propeller repeat protein [Planctomycetales bacterium]